MFINDYCVPRVPARQKAELRGAIPELRHSVRELPDCESGRWAALDKLKPATIDADVRKEVLYLLSRVNADGTVKGRIRDVATFLGLPFERIRQYRDRRIRRITAQEALQILKRARIFRRDEYERIQAEQEKRRQELANIHPLLERLLPPVLGLPDDPASGSENSET